MCRVGARGICRLDGATYWFLPGLDDAVLLARNRSCVSCEVARATALWSRRPSGTDIGAWSDRHVFRMKLTNGVGVLGQRPGAS